MKTVLLINFFISTLLVSSEKKALTKEGITIKYPAHWVVQNIPGYTILISEPAGDSLTFMSTFDVEISSEKQSVDDFCKAYEAKITNSETFKKFVIKSKKEIEFKGHPATEYHCTASVSYLPVEWKSVVIMNKGKIYKFSATSLIGKFYLLRETIDELFDSVQIGD